MWTKLLQEGDTDLGDRLKKVWRRVFLEGIRRDSSLTLETGSVPPQGIWQHGPRPTCALPPSPSINPFAHKYRWPWWGSFSFTSGLVCPLLQIQNIFLHCHFYYYHTDWSHTNLKILMAVPLGSWNAEFEAIVYWIDQLVHSIWHGKSIQKIELNKNGECYWVAPSTSGVMWKYIFQFCFIFKAAKI